MKFKPFTLNIAGRIRKYDRPAVMGILNVTPDSFYADSRTPEADAIGRRVERMLTEGADMIDVGGYSSRPGADEVSASEETERVCRGIEAVRSLSADIPVSVDTFRADVAEAAVAAGANIINDISGGTADEAMLATVARLKTPYVLMHMRGTPQTMQQLTDYTDVTADVIAELSAPLHRLQLMGVADVIIDPGFGFAKTTEQNYELMRNLPAIESMLGRPVLVGISRKSMITRIAGCTPAEALPGTIALDTFAAMAGASILRVHDVGAARQALDVTLAIEGQFPTTFH